MKGELRTLLLHNNSLFEDFQDLERIMAQRQHWSKSPKSSNQTEARFQFVNVVVHDSSVHTTVSNTVPQRSVLGLTLFTDMIYASFICSL